MIFTILYICILKTSFKMSNCTRIYKANMHFTDFCVIYDIVESLCDKPLEDGPQDPHVIADIMMMP